MDTVFLLETTSFSGFLRFQGGKPVDSMKVKDYLPTVNQDCGNAPKYEKLLERHIGILKMEAGLKREFYLDV